jgi:triacylglycerol esterase/lipase EstA (alpha/beta hydrolase family)
MAIALKKEAGGAALDRLSRAPVTRDLVPVATEKRTPDLHRYYDPQDALAGNVRGLLEARLMRAHASGRPIVLLAHSMGSIIAYDVLCDLAQRTSVTIDHFITFGSPLGLSEVKRHQRQEPRTVPGNVRRWTNLADRRDFVALDSKLATDYSANREGVRINDVPVVNGYVDRKGKANPHKIYGYLRTPEFTALLAEAAH